MSADLLAEFDSFYQPPTNKTNNGTASSSTQSSSAFDDLSFFGGVNPIHSNVTQPHSQGNLPLSKPSDGIWGDFSGLDESSQQRVAADPVHDAWSSFNQAGSTGASAILGPPSPQKSRYEGSVHQRYKARMGSLKPGVIRTSTDELFSGNIADLAESTAARVRQQSGIIQGSPLNQASTHTTKSTAALRDIEVVLFDAADEIDGEDEDDEFGEFESVQLPTPQIDLLQIDDPVPDKMAPLKPEPLSKLSPSLIASPFPYPQAPKSPSFQERNPFSDLALSTTAITDIRNEDIAKEESPITAWPVYVSEAPKHAPYQDSPAAKDADDDEWGEFADLPAETAIKNARPLSGIEADAWAWDLVDNRPPPGQTKTIEAPPPTNIPPPSVLLGILPQLFDLPQSSLFKAVASQPFSLKNRILSDPATIDFLRGYILIAIVAARIIAGRKLRWKRDTHLSQAMKIGPAAAGGKGGMKLTGVDRAESAREEREAADVVQTWREQVGRLRSAIATANSSIHDKSAHLIVPEISETMVIKPEGGLTAPKACALCGLKREERISKVDMKVEDSFGEWWVEYWGHTACRNFWQEHESKLKQR